jgi:Holliday junction resolvase RusA-like endonuclease
MTTIHLTGEPIPKQRPRVGKHGHAYTPKATRDAELAIRWQIIAQKVKPTSHPWLGITVVIRTSTNRRSDGDNLLKTVLDAGNGYAWKDDSQIVKYQVHLIRGSDQPGITLEIRELTEQEATQEEAAA